MKTSLKGQVQTSNNGKQKMFHEVLQQKSEQNNNKTHPLNITQNLRPNEIYIVFRLSPFQT